MRDLQVQMEVTKVKWAFKAQDPMITMIMKKWLLDSQTSFDVHIWLHAKNANEVNVPKHNRQSGVQN